MSHSATVHTVNINTDGLKYLMVSSKNQTDEKNICIAVVIAQIIRPMPWVRWMSMAMLAFHDEPTTYDEAINSSDKNHWIEVMRDEYDSLMTNKTWILVEKPNNQKVIDNQRWVYNVKWNPDASIERYKARLIGLGFTQVYGMDYEETFSPVVRYTSIRTILAIVAQNKYMVKQFDVKTAFLYGELEENVYMKQPIGFEDDTGRVC